MRNLTVIAVLLAAGWPALLAQPSPPETSCDPPPEVRRILDEKLSEEALQEMKFAERVAFRRDVLEDLIAKYPREVEPYRRLIEASSEDDTGHYAMLIDRFRKQAALQPDDPLALYVAGLALSGIDTPASIRFLERARSEAPGFAWPALELANIYTPGAKRADKKKSAEEIAAFFAACPSSTDASAQHRLGIAGTSELQARVAAAVRVWLRHRAARSGGNTAKLDREYKRRMALDRHARRAGGRVGRRDAEADRICQVADGTSAEETFPLELPSAINRPNAPRG